MKYTIGVPSGVGDFYLEKAITDPRTKCVIWIGAVNGTGSYPVVYRGTKKQPTAHRVTRSLMRTPREQEACHRCNQKRCINIGHLYNATHHQNMVDAARDGLILKRKGDESPRALLTAETVLRLRVEKPYWKRGDQVQEARRLGLSKSTLSKAILGKNWGHL